MIDKDLKIDNHELKETKKNGIIKTKNNIFNLNEIYYKNTKINEIVNMVLKKYYIIFNMTLLLFFYIQIQFMKMNKILYFIRILFKKIISFNNFIVNII